MRLKAIGIEALWLLGCYAVACALYGLLMGTWLVWQGTLDIQMHNTYFVIRNAEATLLLFLLVALVVTSARAIAAPLRTRYTWMVWLVLGMPVALGVLCIVLIKKKIIG